MALRSFFLSRTASTLLSIGDLKGDFLAGLGAWRLLSKRGTSGLSMDDEDDALAVGSEDVLGRDLDLDLADRVTGRLCLSTTPSPVTGGK